MTVVRRTLVASLLVTASALAADPEVNAAPVAVTMYVPAATFARSTVVAVKLFGPVHATLTALVIVRSTAPLAMPQVVGVMLTNWITGPELTTTELSLPAAMRLHAGSVAGTLACPQSLRPHAATVPLVRSASVWSYPDAIAVTVPRFAGTLH